MLHIAKYGDISNLEACTFIVRKTITDQYFIDVVVGPEKNGQGLTFDELKELPAFLLRYYVKLKSGKTMKTKRYASFTGFWKAFVNELNAGK